MKALPVLFILAMSATAHAISCPENYDPAQCRVAYVCQESVAPQLAIEIQVLETVKGITFEIFKPTGNGKRYNSGTITGLQKNQTDEFVDFYYPKSRSLLIELKTGISTYTQTEWGGEQTTSNYLCQKQN